MADSSGFLKYARKELPLRDTGTRVKDWCEIYARGSSQSISTQATRCMDCGVPFCQSHTGCPLHNLIPDWNSLVSRGDWLEALRRLEATNNFPEFTGRLCPAPCESACVLGINSDSVSIKSIEWSIIERGFDEGWIRPKPATQTLDHRVAIVGSGPAGLAAAQQLARAGHQVTVFEKESQLGGLLRFGIPDFKFEKWQVDRRIVQLEQEGVVFKTGVTLGKDIHLEELKNNFDAVALTIGSERPRDLQVPGRDLGGVHFAMDYLIDKNRVVSGVQSIPQISAKGLDVIILGGGDTGSDCLGSVLREGAKSVWQFELLPKPPVHRSPQTPWPLWPMKLKTSHAHDEGGLRDWNLTTTALQGPSDSVEKLIARRTNSDEELIFETQLVLLAMGYTGPITETFGATPGLQLALDSRGCIKTDAKYQTSVADIYSAGDARRGASLIVWAIAEGRAMAASIHEKFISS